MNAFHQRPVVRARTTGAHSHPRPPSARTASRIATAIVAAGWLVGVALVAVALLKWSDWSSFVASKYLIAGLVLAVGMALCLVMKTWRASGAICLVSAAFAAYGADVFIGLAYLQEILQIVKDLGIDVLDFQRTVEALPDPLVCYNLRITGHFSPEGYRLLVETILDTWVPTSTIAP